MLYLDNSATTQVLPEVKDAMLPYLLEEFGNPSSKYYSLATNASKAVKEARENVASLVGCDPDEVVFTSGATESNNMIIKGVADYYRDKGNHIVTTKVEHPAVLEACKYLEQRDYKVTYLDVDQFGRINIDDFKQVIKEDPPVLVSIIWGNNEVGSLNPINEIAELCEEQDIFFHTDATQVIGKVKFSLSDYPGINFLSGSAHKLHGPKGTGMAILRKDSLGIPVKLTPLMHGGGQERDYRSGTLAVHNIVGFGKAAELAYKNLTHNVNKLEELESTLSGLLKEKFSDHISFNNDHQNKIPGIINVQFKGVNNEVLVKSLADHIASSTGSACSSSKPSHVLEAMGCTIEEIRSTVRFSISPTINSQDLAIFNEL
ncbi:cysteine desulfurase family protein [Pseudalkalibacillus sp. NRS-1564]|uniref:cysteine desulfurase family protein n=1 Tax=Pseudalkalibacillus sp. NRS-1564 TaxID=3233900 RepID=UPI003D29F2F6